MRTWKHQKAEPGPRQPPAASRHAYFFRVRHNRNPRNHRGRCERLEATPLPRSHVPVLRRRVASDRSETGKPVGEHPPRCSSRLLRNVAVNQTRSIAKHPMPATIHTNSSPRAAAFSVVAFFLALPAATDVAPAQEGVTGWGSMVVDSSWHGESFVGLAAGYFQTFARRSNGSVVALGSNFEGQCNVPTLPTGLSYVDVAVGAGHTVARRSDGSVLAWGHNVSGQCNVPALPPGLSY